MGGDGLDWGDLGDCEEPNETRYAKTQRDTAGECVNILNKSMLTVVP